MIHRTNHLEALADEVLARCETLALETEEPGRLTRTFLKPPMKRVHEHLTGWMERAGMTVRLDQSANLIGHYPAEGGRDDAPVVVIGSHLDTVPNAGKYDGMLGVLLGLAAVEALGGRRLPFAVEVVGFSEEEGVRFRTPYLGSLALCSRFDPAYLDLVDDDGLSMAEAFRQFGLDPALIGGAASPPGRIAAYFEVHIEQGPVLESWDLPVGVVSAIAGQSRLWVTFKGKAGHAGTSPMDLRLDPLPAAAELVLAVEALARSVEGLRGTVGSITASPGAVNVVPDSVRMSLDVRHEDDEIRRRAVEGLLADARENADRRGLSIRIDKVQHYSAVPADPILTDLLASAVSDAGIEPRQLVSGAGHDAAVMANLAPMAMLFLRSPGGISHHPDEQVAKADVRVALDVILRWLSALPLWSRMMDPFGTSRSRVRRDHALIAPDSFVRSPIPGWKGTKGVVLVAPSMGARFVQYLALMEPGGVASSPKPGVERVLFVLDGEVEVELTPGVPHALGPGGFAYSPPDGECPLRAVVESRLCVFEKRYERLPEVAPPSARAGAERDVPGEPFLGDPDALLQVLLPDEPAFDLAVNVFTYQPGATLPMVEVHVMEHGLLMLEGQGVYRLGDSWYPVREGDAIWMAPYCPQWFVAMGKGPARYLYYKDVNRDSLRTEP